MGTNYSANIFALDKNIINHTITSSLIFLLLSYGGTDKIFFY